MTELDKLYEEIGRLLEAQSTWAYYPEPFDEEDIKEFLKNNGCTLEFISKPYVDKNTNEQLGSKIIVKKDDHIYGLTQGEDGALQLGFDYTEKNSAAPGKDDGLTQKVAVSLSNSQDQEQGEPGQDDQEEAPVDKTSESFINGTKQAFINIIDENTEEGEHYINLIKETSSDIHEMDLQKDGTILVSSLPTDGPSTGKDKSKDESQSADKTGNQGEEQ